jgi:hypothetical protein
VNRVQAVRVHVVREARGAADPRHEDVARSPGTSGPPGPT